MSSIARPPDPCLVAIILIVRSRTGPRLVYHYPPNPLSENRLKTTTKGGRRTRNRQWARNTDSSSSDESGLSSDEDEEEREVHVAANASASASLNVNVNAAPGWRASNVGLDDHLPVSASSGAGESQRPASLGSGRASSLRKRGGVGGGASSDLEEENSDRPEDGSGRSSRLPWESLLGLPGSVWEKLLSPSRSWHKRRFEVGINDLALIGWPVFVREDGTWRKQRRKKKKKKPRAEWEGGELGHNEAGEDGTGENTMVLSPEMAASTVSLGDSVVSPTDTTKRGSGTSSKLGKLPEESLDSEDKDHMTMFNVMFVMDPPLLEYSLRVKEIYENIIKKFAKALKWEQARTDYVWRESQHILQVRRKAREASMASPYLLINLDLADNANRNAGPQSLLRFDIPIITGQGHLHGLHQHLSFEDRICIAESGCLDLATDSASHFHAIPYWTYREGLSRSLAHYSRQRNPDGRPRYR